MGGDGGGLRGFEFCVFGVAGDEEESGLVGSRDLAAGSEQFVTGEGGFDGADGFCGGFIVSGADGGEERDVGDRAGGWGFEGSAIDGEKQYVGIRWQVFSECVDLSGVAVGVEAGDFAGGITELSEDGTLVLFEGFSVEGGVEGRDQAKHGGGREQDVESGNFPEEFGLEPGQDRAFLLTEGLWSRLFRQGVCWARYFRVAEGWCHERAGKGLRS